MLENAIRRTVGKLLLMAGLMFGFGYALVPLYDVFCEVTGFNGRTSQVSTEVVDNMTTDMDRVVTVAFDTNIREIPWEFDALERKVSVHPGQLGEATFVVENKSDRRIVGRAVPSVAPTQASSFFSKTECFCFTEQVMEAGERREMTVRFIVDAALPKQFSALTLSYTFFAIPGSDKVVKSQEDDGQNKI